MRTIWMLSVVLMGGCVWGAEDTEKSTPKAASELPEIRELPNPFVFLDGSRVRSADDWQRRRAELKGMFADYQYGHMLPKPQKMTIERGAIAADEASKLSIQDLTLNLEQEGKTLALHVRLYLPSEARGKLPVVIQSSFGPRMKADGKILRNLRPTGLRGGGVHIRGGRGRRQGCTQRRGLYAVWRVDRLRGTDGVGVVRVTNDRRTGDPGYDRPTKMVVTGHSRYGKASLVAGAFDERIAVTVPSHPDAAARRLTGSSTARASNCTMSWVLRIGSGRTSVSSAIRYRGCRSISICCWRWWRRESLLLTEGTQDAWINPEGAQLTYLAARKVYEFLTAADKISIRFRPVGHIPSNEDLLDFADHVFFDKPLPEEFGKFAYPEEKNGFAWKCRNRDLKLDIED